ncbi:restriction endonuclease [Paenisporosarcina antarctica]|nr:restriction endonuclease [Paenisporosarcina antarctica]
MERCKNHGCVRNFLPLVNSPSKEYCNQCYQFSNRHRGESQIKRKNKNKVCKTFSCIREIVINQTSDNSEYCLQCYTYIQGNYLKKEIHSIKKEWQTPNIDTLMVELDKMSGIEFEYYLKEFFQKRDYMVELTALSGDQGVDLILIKHNRRIAVQVKRYSQDSKLGNKAIQEVYTGMPYYDCTEAYVITTTEFTNQAVTLASKVGVKLIGRNKLQLLVSTGEIRELDLHL